jgi:transposase
MSDIPPAIEIYPVHHLPIIKAYADQLGLVSLINHYVPTEMEVDAGTVVLGLVLDTLSGRSPLYRLEEFFAQQDTALLLGKTVPPQALHDDTVGRVLDRLYDCGTMKLFTACAVRAATRFGVERRYVPFDTTSRSVWGDSQFAETQDLPLQVTYGYSKDKRPDLKQFVLSTLCVDRAVPIWGKPEDGNASDKALNATLWSEIAQLLAQYGVQPGAYIYIADAALVTADNRTALRATFFITRLPATYSECGRVIAEAVAHNDWEEVGVLAQTPPTKRRPGTCYKVAERSVTLYGQAYRAVVVHSSSQDQRRQQHLRRERQASAATLEATVREVAPPEDAWQADAEAGAAQLRALQSAYHRVEVMVEERPTYGPGRPSQQRPRVVQALRYGLKLTLHERAEVIARKTQEAGCLVLLTNVPTEGAMAHTAREVRRAYKEQHGVEQNFAFLQDPLIVHSLFLKKPERIEALGVILLLALLLWRLVERALRVHVETTGSTLTGWDKTATQKPTAFRMMTKCAAVMVIKVGANASSPTPCRRSNSNTSWRWASRPRTTQCPRVAKETRRASAGAKRPRADRGGGVQPRQEAVTGWESCPPAAYARGCTRGDTGVMTFGRSLEARSGVVRDALLEWTGGALLEKPS